MYFPEELWGIIKSFAYIFNKDAIEYQRQFRMSLNRTFTCPLLTFDLWQVDDTLMAYTCLLYTSPSPRDRQKSRMPSSA